MGEDRATAKEEIAALRLGIELGLTHIDTAEMYGDGGAERIVAQAVAGQRDKVFIATKVLPSNASYAGTLRACELSLKRLKTDYVDLYLLHWWSNQHPIGETLRAMEELVARGVGGSAMKRMRYIADRTFYESAGRWYDSRYDAGKDKTRKVKVRSDDYFKLIDENPAMAKFLALGKVTVEIKGEMIEVEE